MAAEFGKVKTIENVSDLQAGMKIHRDIMGRGGKVLVAAGEVLTHKHTRQLQKWDSAPRPMGQALPKKNPKDWREKVQHVAFVGGHRVADFNPHGFVVSGTLASGDEIPEVERDPTKSPLFQNSSRKSFAVPANGTTGDEEDNIRMFKLNQELKTLRTINAQLGGQLHETPDPVEPTREALTDLRDQLNADNTYLISALQKNKGNGNGHTAEPAAKRGGRASGRSRR